MKNLRSDNTSPRDLFRMLRRDEDGSIIIFSLMMFVLILWFGGMAVDLMRFETTRTKLQGTLDRAVLAAADLDQTLPPAEVCADYFAKAGMSQFLDTCIVDQGINYRVVTAVADAEMPLFFYDLPSVFSSPFSAELSSLTVSGTSTAEERVTDVEVSLVLDVSGSMNSNSRIQNLRPAARDFVTTVLSNNTNAPQGLITISIVPYSAVVNPGTLIEPYLNINRSHDESACLLFDDDEFETTELDLSATYDHVSHFDPSWYSDSNSASDGDNLIKYPWCHVGDHNAIIPHTTNESDLHDAIDDLEPYGNTAIDMGVKWAAALLDPSTNAIISGLAGQAGTGVPAIASPRPEEFGQSDILKVIVVMTDGQNTTQYDLVPTMKWDLSRIWFDRSPSGSGSPIDLEEVDYYSTSVQYAGENTTSRTDDYFYWDISSSTISRSQRYPRGFANRDAYLNSGTIAEYDGIGSGTMYDDNMFNASWSDMMAIRVYNQIDRDWLRRAYIHEYISYNEYKEPEWGIDTGIVNSTEANARLSDICEAARDEGIVIYTVAFEAPSNGQTALRDCASTPSHYFDVQGSDISDAFAAIATNIRNLKLTQ
ncbi:TadE/TadG family type IV pilus assembly protein [Octadecabacter temperatus]|nr:TadE/TadG family type IV pilus assembly protein [Octadecabacter temperatus]